MNINIKRDFYTMASVDGKNAEITLYGDIVENVPVNYWTGEVEEGDFIVQSEFLEDLKSVEGCRKITIRMNSCGGNAAVAILIHNRLRELAEKGVKLTCIVDGVAMSGGSLIMCACDKVKVNDSSIIMIHKCWASLFGGYNADELRNLAKSNDAYDKSQVSIYQRKCKLSEDEIMEMMGNTTHMTGKEAVEKGFADELCEDEGLLISASEDRTKIFVNGRRINVTGAKIPEIIPTVKTAEVADDDIKTNPKNGKNKEGGKNTMAKTLEELRNEYPELIGELEGEAREAAEKNTKAAVEEERERLKKIDEVASLFDEELVREAKYGDEKISAEQLAYKAAIAAKEQGKAFMASLKDGYEESGAEGVTAAPGASDEDIPKTKEEKYAEMKSLLKGAKGE